MKKSLKVFIIDAKTSMNKTEEFKIGDFFGPADLGFYLSKKYNSINIGIGLFADTSLSGSNRLIFTGYSPAWDGFYISAMGGAGYVFERLGISTLSIIGKAKKPSVLYLNHNENGKLISKIEELDVEKIWKNGGVYSLMNHVYEKYKDNYKKDPRILAIGESAKSTDFGAVCSAPIKGGKITHVDTWAGRGGFGSKLYQDHNIVAIIYGGVSSERGFNDKKAVNNWFEEKYGMNFAQKDKEVTKKYNFVDILKTGGTLGVNYSSLGVNLLSFNYTSVKKDEKTREDIDKNFIKNHYLKQFNEETIETRNFKNCGEPCAVMCKKMNDNYKKDYEPYQAMGPLLGIFDQRAAEKVNYHSDSYGFDAISIGGVLGWLMESMIKGYIKPEDLGVTTLPVFDSEEFDVVETSNHNAQIAIQLLDSIIQKKGLVDLKEGARVFAKKLSKEINPKIIDLFAYNANGKKGWMVPNQYWTPGVLSPMALMGKYYMYYGNDFVPPYELGIKNAGRFIAELMIDNIAICRFHRGWAEEMTPEIIGKLYNLEDEFVLSIKSLALKINEQGKPVYWESKRNIEIIDSFLKNKESIKYEKELKEWKELFKNDENSAAEKFWKEIYKGAQDYFKKIKNELETDVTHHMVFIAKQESL